MESKEYNRLLCELLVKKRSLHNFIEREARQYPAQRSRFEHRQAAKKMLGWDELILQIKELGKDQFQNKI
ncbi:MAG: hypothetical protein AABY22_25590 [Nanoarchaeota archaeon]